MECGAILDVFKTLRLIDEKKFQDGKELLIQIVSMLTKMCFPST